MSMYYPLIFNFSYNKIENIILLTLRSFVFCHEGKKKVNEDEEREGWRVRRGEKENR